MSDRQFNIAGRIADLFVDSKLTPLLILGVAVFGALSLYLTPREENPQILVPAAQVSVPLPGATAREVEALVLTPLEAALSELSDIEHTYGTAQESLASVQVEFDVGVPKEDALVRVYDKVAEIRRKLPSGAGEPVVVPIDADDVPIVTVTLAAADYSDYALKRIADRMSQRLQSLRGVSEVIVHGGRDREIRVELDPTRMQAFGITLDQGLTQLAQTNIARPIGNLARNGERQSIYLAGQIDSVERLRRLVVGERNGRLIYLEDVAEVVDGPREERVDMARIGFGPAAAQHHEHPGELPAVTIAVAKKRGENAVRIADAVLERVSNMADEFVPGDVLIVTTRNDGVKANEAVNLLVEHLGIAILVVVITLLITLGWREGLMIMLVVPLVMLTVIMIDNFADVTLNRVALFALILALGSLVDDAIVVVENIHRHYLDNPGASRRELAVKATAEIGNATNFATFSMMAVFACMIVVSGMQGEFFFPITFNLPVAMFVSLVFAYVVTPWTAYRWLDPKPALAERAAAQTQQAGAFFDRFLCLLLDHAWARWLLLVTMIALVVLTSVMPAWQYLRPDGPVAPKSEFGLLSTFLPKDDLNSFNIFVDMPENATIEMTDAATRDVGRVLRANPHVKNYLVSLGMPGVTDLSNLLRGSLNRSQRYQAEVRVNLVHKRDRAEASVAIVNALRYQLYEVAAGYPGAVIRVFDDPPGPPVRAKLMAEVYGTSLEDIRRTAARVREEFEATPNMYEIADSEAVDVVRYRVLPDTEKAALAGVTTRQIAEVLGVLYGGVTVGRVHMEEERNVVPIRIEVPRRYELDIHDLNRVYVTNHSGKTVPVSELVRVVQDLENKPILHKDNERVVFVSGEYLPASGVFAVMDMNERLRAIGAEDGRALPVRNLGLYDSRPDTSQGTELLWEGETRMMMDSYRDMTFALVLAISIVYLMLVGYYGSFLIPLIALAALPLSFIGVFPGHYIMGAEFSGASMVGIIALVGMVVRASLLIIEFGRDAQAQGANLREAMRQACALRMRPIVLTSLTNMLGSTVMLLDPVFRGLAISVIYGTGFSTVLTMIVVPTLYFALMKRRGPKALEGGYAG